METVDIKNISFDEKGLVPAIVQNARSGEILMMAYMNQESLQKTIETGETWFFSRSRQKLWHKGEESAHFQHVKKIFVDCDADTLIVQVIPDGPACHTNHPTCFFRSLTEWENREETGSLAILHTLFEEIKDRRAHPQDKSYTNYLHQDKEEIIDESCDLLYHLFVMWENSGVDLYDIMRKLGERDEKKGNKKKVGHQDKIF